MEETENSKKKVTLQEVMQIIDSTKQGEYDALHEWSPCYTGSDKVRFLDQIMNDWDITEAEGRKVIIQFIREIAKETREVSNVLTDSLVKYAKLPEIIQVVGEFLNSGLFCYNLLLSMKNYHVEQNDWLTAIRTNSDETKFIERKKDLKRLNLYQVINDLIKEVS